VSVRSMADHVSAEVWRRKASNRAMIAVTTIIRRTVNRTRGNLMSGASVTSGYSSPEALIG